MADDWNTNLRSIPREQAVRVKTVTGIECIALVKRGTPVRKPDGNRVKSKRINAFRLDPTTFQTIGDVRAVAWKLEPWRL